MARSGTLLVLALLALLAGSATAATAIKTTAFNIQVFGTTKAAKADVMASIVQVLVKYDLIFVQEIRESTDNAINQLLSELNAASTVTYKMSLSRRLGRTTSTEQYAFFYNSSKVRARIVSSYSFVCAHNKFWSCSSRFRRRTFFPTRAPTTLSESPMLDASRPSPGPSRSTLSASTSRRM